LEFVGLFGFVEFIGFVGFLVFIQLLGFIDFIAFNAQRSLFFLTESQSLSLVPWAIEHFIAIALHACPWLLTAKPP